MLLVITVIAAMTAGLNVMIWYGTTTFADQTFMTEEAREDFIRNGAGVAIAGSVFAISVAVGLWKGSRMTRNVAVVVGALLCLLFGFIAFTGGTGDRGLLVKVAGAFATALPWAGLTALLLVPASSKKWFTRAS